MSLVSTLSRARSLGYVHVALRVVIALLLVGTVSGGVAGPRASAQPADSPWPVPNHDLRNSRQSAHAGPTSPVGAQWTVETAGAVRLPVLGPDGDVYVGADRFVYRIAADGETRWRVETCAEVSSLSIGAGGVVYAGDRDGTLYAIAPDGTKQWQFGQAKRRLGTTAPGPDGTIFAVTEEVLYAINDEGTLKWLFDGDGELVPMPAFGDDGTVYVGAEGALTALAPDGTERWTVAVDGKPMPTVTGDGRISVASGTQAVEIRPDGTVENRIDLKGPIEAIVGRGPDGTRYAFTQRQSLLALRPDGTLKWRDEGGGRPTLPTVGAKGTVLIGTGRGTVRALGPDGREQWTYDTGGEIDSSPVLGRDGTVYVGSNDHRLYRIGSVDHGDAAPDLGISHDTLTISVSSYSGQYSGSEQITIRNEGTAPLEGRIALRDSGAFSVAEGGGAYRLKAGEARTVTVKYRSREGPEMESVLSVRHNGADSTAPLQIPVRSHETRSIFVNPEQQPELVGGGTALEEDVRYPEAAESSGLDGKVFVEFVVDPQGTVKNPTVRRTMGPISADTVACDVTAKFHEAALRAIEQQSFAPGTQEGRTVSVEMVMPVVFEAPGTE